MQCPMCKIRKIDSKKVENVHITNKPICAPLFCNCIVYSYIHDTLFNLSEKREGAGLQLSCNKYQFHRKQQEENRVGTSWDKLLVNFQVITIRVLWSRRTIMFGSVTIPDPVA